MRSSRPGPAKTISRRALLGVAACLSVAACEMIAGTKSVTLDPVNTANALPGYGANTVPTSYVGRIRIADLALTPGNVDFCIRASGTTSWGEPVMFDSGTDAFFRSGLSYPQVTIPFSVPSGKLDVKFITAGGTCASPTLSEGDGIPVGVAVIKKGSGALPAPAVTVLRYGGAGAGSERVVGLPEELAQSRSCPSDAVACSRFRVVNATGPTNAINVGETVGDATALPAAIALPPVLSAPILPGHAASPQPLTFPFGSVDGSGYLGLLSIYAGGSQPGIDLGVAVYPPSSPPSSAAAAIFKPSPSPDVQTLFFIGDSSNETPFQGLLVEDGASAGTADAGGGQQWLAKSTLTTPRTISVDTLDGQLWGLASPYIDARVASIAPTVAARPTDVICLTGIDRDAYKATIIAKASAGNFPYSYWVPTTIMTPPTSALNWFGVAPPLVTTAACASQTAQTMANAAACASKCSTGANGGEDASVSSITCLEQACAVQLARLTSDYTCLDCLGVYFVTPYAIDFTVNECASDANDPYGQFEWGGQNGALLLSRLPFAKKADGVTDDTEAYVFPASNFRTAALRARLQVDPAHALDVYCGELETWQNADIAFQYVGSYATPDAGLYPGETTDPNAGWRDETNLQARDLVNWIKSESGGAPAIVAGEWRSGPAAATDAGVPLLEPFAPEVYQQLISAGLVPAHPAGYTPECTGCNPNPYSAPVGSSDDAGPGTDQLTTFLYGFPANSAWSEQIWNKDPSSWTVTPLGGDGGLVPFSNMFPRTVTILLP